MVMIIISSPYDNSQRCRNKDSSKLVKICCVCNDRFGSLKNGFTENRIRGYKMVIRGQQQTA
jgi:hypothetical protein